MIVRVARQVTILGLIAGLSLVALVGIYQRLYQPVTQIPSSATVNSSVTQTRHNTPVQVSFLAVGDILLSRHVAERIEQSHDVQLPFVQMAEFLRETDFNFGNLESPVSGVNRIKGRGLIFNTSTSHVDGLASNNFRIVNLANNHALDQGVKGLKNTKRVLAARNIEIVGVGDDKFEAWTPKVITVRSIRIGFIGASYASINDGGVLQNNYVARIEELDRLRASIEQVKASADFIVITMHAGVEYRRHPHASQVAFAQAAIDYGADLVVGVHPHWIQTIQEYRGKYIFYSLGNFVFDQGHREDTREGLALKVVLQKQPSTPGDPVGTNDKTRAVLDRVELIPIVIERCVPRRATEKEAARILRKIGVVRNVLAIKRE